MILVHTRNFFRVRVEQPLGKFHAMLKGSDSFESIEKYFVGQAARNETETGLVLRRISSRVAVWITWVVGIVAEFDRTVLNSPLPRPGAQGEKSAHVAVLNCARNPAGEGKFVGRKDPVGTRIEF